SSRAFAIIRAYLCSRSSLFRSRRQSMMSDEAAKKWLTRLRREGRAADRLTNDGINRTPEIAKAWVDDDVRDYVEKVAKMVGQTVTPASSNPRSNDLVDSNGRTPFRIQNSIWRCPKKRRRMSQTATLPLRYIVPV